MVHGKVLILKEKDGEDGKDGQGDYLLNHLQLPEIKWSAILLKAQSVGWNLKTVLNQCDTPTEKDDHGESQL